MLQYHAISPSATRKDKEGQPIPAFTGNITLGIRFDENHEAYFNDLTVKKTLGLSAKEVATRMVLDFDYRVTVVGDDRSETPFDPHEGNGADRGETAAEKAEKAPRKAPARKAAPA